MDAQWAIDRSAHALACRRERRARCAREGRYDPRLEARMARTRSARPAGHLLQRHDDTGVERFEARWCGHRTQHHAHPEYQITLSVAGAGRFTYLGGEARVPAGCMAIFHPGEPHAIGNAERAHVWDVRSLHVPPAWLERAGRPLLAPAPVLADAELLGAFDAVWGAFDAPTRSIEEALLRLSAVLRARPGLEPKRAPSSELVRRCLVYMAEHLDQPLRLSELAEAVGTSPARVRRAVLGATGLPPLAWHLQRRIQESKHRLARGDGIAATALATGFADQAHFTRHFTRLVGVSPSRYAAGVRGRDDGL
jgi:AraC-like DNA-binding protein